MSEATTPALSISQALRYASKLKGKIADARTRAASSITHKAGEETAFDFKAMLDSADTLSDELAALQGRIAVANATNSVIFEGNQISLSHAVRVLQELKGRIAWVKGLTVLQVESVEQSDVDWDDVAAKSVRKSWRMICRLPEAARAALVDQLQEKFDRLNGAVESINQVTFLT
jgi:hypothetical protein